MKSEIRSNSVKNPAKVLFTDQKSAPNEGEEHVGSDNSGRGLKGGNSVDSNSVGDRPTLFVRGIPTEISDVDVRKFLLERIPNAENVRHFRHRDQGQTLKGLAFVQLRFGVNVETVLNQVEGLEMGGRRLRMIESKPRIQEPVRIRGGGNSGGFSGGNSGGFGGGNSGGSGGGSYGGFGGGSSGGFGGGNSGGFGGGRSGGYHG